MPSPMLEEIKGNNLKDMLLRMSAMTVETAIATTISMVFEMLVEDGILPPQNESEADKEIFNTTIKVKMMHALGEQSGFDEIVDVIRAQALLEALK